jgi:hypothetical protein
VETSVGVEALGGGREGGEGVGRLIAPRGQEPPFRTEQRQHYKHHANTHAAAPSRSAASST